MTAIIFLLRFFLYSIIGHYIVRLVSKKNELFYSPISPTYGIFALLASISNISSIVELFLLGIIWGIAIDFFSAAVNKKLSLELHIPLYGLLNIVNFLVLEPAISKVINMSSPESIVFLFFTISMLFLADVSISLRNNI